MSELVFANVICGVIRGALEMVHMRVECRFTGDMLKGDPVNAIRSVLRTQHPPPPHTIPCSRWPHCPSATCTQWLIGCRGERLSSR